MIMATSKTIAVAQFLDSLLSHFFLWLPDRIYLRFKFRFKMGYWFDFDNPKTFSEKLQWLKLNNQQSEYVMMVDKYEVKKYVTKKIGEQYVVPLLGVWNSTEEIDFSTLPDKFVLKTTHGGGSTGVVICKDKTKLDKDLAFIKLNRSLKHSIYLTDREWPYKNVPRRIIAEQYIEEKTLVSGKITEELSDYKFFCFNGKPMYCQVIRDRHENESIDFYDMNWQHQEFVGLNPFVCNGMTPVPCPSNLKLMIDICIKLSEDIPFVRVDLYSVGDLVYFGELTFFPASGFGKFRPDEWNMRLGDMINLTYKKEKYEKNR